MRPTSSTVIQQLKAAFPPRAVVGVITPHDCKECSAIRRHLSGKSWNEIADEFAEEFNGSLPLLSADAFNAYLPIWLRAAINNPDGAAASMVVINLSDKPSHLGFTESQIASLIAVVQYILDNDYWAKVDPGENLAKIARVRSEWGNGVA